MFICLWWQGVSFIAVCLLETAAVDVSLSPVEMLQLFNISTVCVGLLCGLSVFFDGTAGCCYQATGPSVLCRNERITLARPAVFAPVFIRVSENACMHVFESLGPFSNQLNFTSNTQTACSGPTPARPLFVFMYFCSVRFTTSTCSQISIFFHSLISFYFLFILHAFYLLPFFSSGLTNLIPLPFLLSSPCSPPFSRPSWGA